jgi:sigma-B regulation protein RsbU (phosphoserine phosphatase)
MAAVILVVDDEPDIEPLMRQMFRRAIRDGRYELKFARDGEDALGILSKDGADLVLTDLNMPRMDGLTLLRAVLDARTDVKSVIVSAFGDFSNIRAGMNCGAFDFLTKPIEPDDLVKTVERALAQLQHERETQRSHTRLIALQQELDWAARIQASILPQPWPAEDDFELAGIMKTAREVGGDFFDYFRVPDGRIGLAIADVCGKGLPAALLMAVSRSLLRAAAMYSLSPDECLTRVNAMLADRNPEMMFATALYAIFDPLTGSVEFANAGHCEPAVIRANGTIAESDTADIPVGIEPAQRYRLHNVQLEPGDTLLLYTDGVTEAMNAGGEMYTKARMFAALAGRERDPVAALLEQLDAEVTAHAGGIEKSDDLTCLMLRRRLRGASSA